MPSTSSDSSAICCRIASRRGPAGLLCALLSVFLVCGCFGSRGGGVAVPPPPPPAGNQPAAAAEPDGDVKWDQAHVAGPPVLLRLSRAPGKLRAYEARFARRQEGPNRYDETAHFYLSQICLDRTAEGFDLVSQQRAYLERTRKEYLENNKIVDRVLPLWPEPVFLGPERDRVGDQWCYAFDARNRMAYKGPEQPPLAMVSDTPHYLFPQFPARKVAPGETWASRVPVVVPNELPTQFPLRVAGRVREVRAQDGSQIAWVDYQYSGQFDSAAPAFAPRFPAEYHRVNRTVHTLTGKGWLTLDVTRGLILEKQDEFSVRFWVLNRFLDPKTQQQKEQETTVNVASRFEMKWLPPGTKLRNGDVVPEER